MNYERWKNCRVDPRRMAYLEIMLRRSQAAKQPPMYPASVRENLRYCRQAELGTDADLAPLVKTQAAFSWQALPDIRGIEMLIGIIVPDLLEARKPRYESESEEIEIFLRLAITYLSTGVNPEECIFDSIIRLAELHEKSPELLQIMYNAALNSLRRKDDFYDYALDALDAYETWLRDHERCSTVSFSEELGYGIACFLGQFKPPRHA